MNYMFIFVVTKCDRKLLFSIKAFVFAVKIFNKKPYYFLIIFCLNSWGHILWPQDYIQFKHIYKIIEVKFLHHVIYLVFYIKWNIEGSSLSSILRSKNLTSSYYTSLLKLYLWSKVSTINHIFFNICYLDLWGRILRPHKNI